jgi:hypothetical protein
MLPIVCFIDDSSFELEIFSECFIPAAPGLDFVIGHDYEQVKAELGDRQPCLFLLDLYGQDPDLNPGMPSKDELKKAMAGFSSLDDVYQGLDDFPGDKTNEFLKRLFHLTDGYRRMFYQAARQAGQNLKYGLGNLDLARRDYPAASAVAYTRKSLVWDAVEAVGAGVDGFFLKPDGPGDDGIRQATKEAAPDLMASLAETVTIRFTTHLKNLAPLLAQSGLSNEITNLSTPDMLSDNAKNVLGQGDIIFLQTAAEWWEYTGQSPII